MLWPRCESQRSRFVVIGFAVGCRGVMQIASTPRWHGGVLAAVIKSMGLVSTLVAANRSRDAAADQRGEGAKGGCAAFVLPSSQVNIPPFDPPTAKIRSGSMGNRFTAPQSALKRSQYRHPGSASSCMCSLRRMTRRVSVIRRQRLIANGGWCIGSGYLIS